MLPQVHLPAAWQLPTETLAQRVVLVTGACGGLGSAVARAATLAGAQVVLTGRRKRQLEQLHDAMCAEGLAPPVLHPLDMEVATPRDYQSMADGIERDFGRLDGIVHAAASFNGLTPLSMHKPDDWLRALHVNVSAPFALTQACLPLLLAAADSAVVFVLDDPQRLQRAHWGGYGVSKAALERLTAILHDETDDGPLRTHALLPAPMRTGLRQKAYFGEDALQWPTPEATARVIVGLLAGCIPGTRGVMLDLRAASDASAAAMGARA